MTRYKNGSDRRAHGYRVRVAWTGNTGAGTADYAGYLRDTVTTAGAKAELAGSSDPAFRGDPERWNPEELLLASLSQCHLLWYLDLAARAGVVVVDYVDDPEASMVVNADGSGQFDRVVLRPVVKVANGAHRDRAVRVHERAHEMCFIARSVSFPVEVEPIVEVAGET
jgi:organic hydroperoxide reductase OsmC/OhrA